MKPKAQLIAEMRALQPDRYGVGLDNLPHEHVAILHEQLHMDKCQVEGGPFDKTFVCQPLEVIEMEMRAQDGKMYKYIRKGNKYAYAGPSSVSTPPE